MKAVVFGTGRIGCGFVGQLLRESGHDVVFAARNPAIVSYMNRVRRYQVRLSGKDTTREFLVDDVRAVSTAEPELVAREVSEAGLVATSVGHPNLPAIAPLLAQGLGLRSDPVNVLAFENFRTTAAFIRSQVEGCSPDGCFFSGHGFSPALVSRVMSEMNGDVSGSDPITFTGDLPGEFIVDGRRIVSPIPEIEGMKVVDNYEAWVQKKLFLFSAGHATTAYLGHLKGYHYIHSAIRDAEIREAVKTAMREGQQGLRARYGEQVAGNESDLEQIVGRFENAALNDSIERVGRDPLRKLGDGDRLVGPARLAEEAGIQPDKLMLAVAAALFYCSQIDPACTAVRQEIQAEGPLRAISEICGLNPDKPLARATAKIFSRFAQRDSMSPLLSLEKFFWA